MSVKFKVFFGFKEPPLYVVQEFSW